VARLIPLPFTLPAETRWRLAQQLDPAQQAALALKAEQIVDGVAAALRGRDAYFPPAQPPDPRVAAAIRAALAAEGELEILYQGLGETAPRARRVAPLWLEEQPWGTYLHAYCYLAEDNRVFRLDRIAGLVE
jgi:predicted DNA-binding transcriptional regulator YafY